MLDLLISLGFGTVSLTREKAEEIVDLLITKGELSREEAKKTINELVERGEKDREKIKDYLQQEIRHTLQKYNLVTREEYLALQERVKALELKCREAEQSEPKTDLNQ